MLNCFAKHPYLWATHLWNMFDFAADARDQGGEPGMNHKGIVTFDRKTKKDSFYLYKAWWSGEPFVHICGRRYVDRPETVTTVKVYSNQPPGGAVRQRRAGEGEVREQGVCVHGSTGRRCGTAGGSGRLH